MGWGCVWGIIIVGADLGIEKTTNNNTARKITIDIANVGVRHHIPGGQRLGAI